MSRLDSRKCLRTMSSRNAKAVCCKILNGKQAHQFWCQRFLYHGRAKKNHAEIFHLLGKCGDTLLRIVAIWSTVKSLHIISTLAFCLPSRSVKRKKKKIRNDRGNSCTLYSLPNAVASSRPLFVPSSILEYPTSFIFLGQRFMLGSLYENRVINTYV